MIVNIDGKQMCEACGRYFTITKSFHNEDPEQNIKDVNTYMQENLNEGVILSKNGDRSIYLADVNDKGVKRDEKDKNKMEG